jgi:MoxR-like ATPase
VRIAAASRPAPDNSLDFINEWVTWGAGLRASQYMVLGAKARALLYGRSHVNFDDIRAMAYPVLRHRILINYRAEAEGVVIEKLVDRLLKSVKEIAK